MIWRETHHRVQENLEYYGCKSRFLRIPLNHMLQSSNAIVLKHQPNTLQIFPTIHDQHENIQ